MARPRRGRPLVTPSCPPLRRTTCCEPWRERDRARSPPSRPAAPLPRHRRSGRRRGTRCRWGRRPRRDVAPRRAARCRRRARNHRRWLSHGRVALCRGRYGFAPGRWPACRPRPPSPPRSRVPRRRVLRHAASNGGTRRPAPIPGGGCGSRCTSPRPTQPVGSASGDPRSGWRRPGDGGGSRFR